MKFWGLQKTKSTILIIALTSSVLSLSGCSSREINQAIVTFGGDVALATKALDTFYRNINRLQRAEYFKQLKYQKTQPIRATKTDSLGRTVQTGLFDQYNSDQILARRKCLEALAKYTGNLALLASSDAPKRTAAELEQLKAPIYDIGTQLATIKRRNTKEIGEDIQAFAGPVAGIASLIGEAWVAGIQDKAIVQCATDAHPGVKLACSQLYGDADGLLKAYNLQVGNTLLLESEEYVTQTDPKIKAEILNDVKASAEAMSVMSTICPSKLVQDLYTVHQDLVACLNSSVFDEILPPQFKPLTIDTALLSIAPGNADKTDDGTSAQSKQHTSSVKSQQNNAQKPTTAETQSETEKPKTIRTRKELIAKALADLAQFDSECKAIAAAVDELTAAKTTDEKKTE